MRIGLLLDFSGAPDTSADRKRAFDLAIRHLNDGGGVLGRPVQGVTADATRNPAPAVRAARHLVEQEGVHAVVGPNASAAALPVVEIVTGLRRDDSRGPRRAGRRESGRRRDSGPSARHRQPAGSGRSGHARRRGRCASTAGRWRADRLRGGRHHAGLGRERRPARRLHRGVAIHAGRRDRGGRDGLLPGSERGRSGAVAGELRLPARQQRRRVRVGHA